MSEMEKRARGLYDILSQYNGKWKYGVYRPDKGYWYNANVILNEAEGYIGFSGGSFTDSSPNTYPYATDWTELRTKIRDYGDVSFTKVVNGSNNKEYTDCYLSAQATYNGGGGGNGLRFCQRSSPSSYISYPVKFYYK